MKAQRADSTQQWQKIAGDLLIDHSAALRCLFRFVHMTKDDPKFEAVRVEAMRLIDCSPERKLEKV